MPTADAKVLIESGTPLRIYPCYSAELEVNFRRHRRVHGLLQHVVWDRSFA